MIIRWLAACVLGACAISCSSSTTDSGGGTPTTTPDAGATGCAKGAFVAVAANHTNNPHTLTIPAADFAATGDKHYRLSKGGGNLHDHAVDLTSDQMAQIKSGTQVQLASGPGENGTGGTGTGGGGGGGGGGGSNNVNPHQLTVSCIQ